MGTVFLSAFLLFMLQPFFAKSILPVLGGATSVWLTLMFVYQALLLFGYGYAHLLSHSLPHKSQAPIHIGFVIASFCWVLYIHDKTPNSPPEGTALTIWLILNTLKTAGIPFFILAATAPLVQHWYSHNTYSAHKSPYPLYSISNIGSFAALLSYPFLLEYFLPLHQQGYLWQWGYAIFIICIVLCALIYDKAPTNAALHLTNSQNKKQPEHTKTPVSLFLLWVLLALVPSSLLLGVTNFITTQVTSTPLLWILPLALYLLSFHLAFKAKPLWQNKHLAIAISIGFLGIAILTISHTNYTNFAFIWHLATFFIIALSLHQRLANLKPATAQLTRFYFALSLGGVLGGGVNAVIAPFVFNGPYEYAIMLLIAALLLPPLQQKMQQKTLQRQPVQWQNPVYVGRLHRFLDVTLPIFAFICVFLPGKTFTIGAYSIHFEQFIPLSVIALGVFIGGALSTTRPKRWGAVAALLLVGQLSTVFFNPNHMHTTRSFYGTYSVFIDPENLTINLISHGSNARQGAQSIDPQKALDTTFFYNFKALKERLPTKLFSLPWASAGLGVGTIACLSPIYAPKHKTTFIEIDPAVIAIAQNPEYFTYLKKCPGTNTVLHGDGRQMLTTQFAPKSLGIIFLDAFSSASVPTHMLTLEAFNAYLKNLHQEGVIAINTTNLHLDLLSLITVQAQHLGLTGVYTNFTKRYRSQWVLLSRKKEYLGTLMQDGDWHPLPPANKTLHPWRDQFTTILPLLK